MEGSVQVDEGSMPSTQPDTSSTDTDTGDQQQSQTQVDTNDSSQGQTQDDQTNQQTNDGDTDTQYTEKGTKLDPNPQSAVHQQLANERRMRQDYETVLNNPELLKKFAKEAGYTLQEAKEAIEEEIYSGENIKTGDDVAKALNEMRSASKKELDQYKAEIQNLKQEVQRIQAGKQIERVAIQMTSDITAIRDKYPELNPKSPEYDKELEQELGLLYHELDAIDPSNPRSAYRGQHSLLSLADRIMKAAGKARKKGSQDAQTNIQVKERGKIVTSSKAPSDKTSESSEPGTAIAQRIAKAYRKK